MSRGERTVSALRDNGPVCALYCRVGCSENSSAEAIELQRRLLLAYARDMGYTNTVAYLDNGYSGLNAERPALTKLNADIAAGKVGAVLAVDMGRLWRNFSECCAWLGRMDKKGVTVLFRNNLAAQEQTDELRAVYGSLDKRKKRKQARHTVRTPPPVPETR